MTNSRAKGKRGELDASKVLSQVFSIPITRSAQLKGSQESADLDGLAMFALHPEIKRDEITISKAMYKAMGQAKRDCGSNVPFVMSRRNKEEWLLTIRVDDIESFCRNVVRMIDNARS